MSLLLLDNGSLLTINVSYTLNEATEYFTL